MGVRGMADMLRKIAAFNEMMLELEPQYKESAAAFPEDYQNQRRLMRSLMNVFVPGRLPSVLLCLQDEILSAEREGKGVVHAMDLERSSYPRIAVWQGDITRLDADAIVNAANGQMLGCFQPCHGCIDNAIHSASGLQLRQECAEMMSRQGHEEPAGRAKITKAYNLPAKYVIHTVGPVVAGRLSTKQELLLASCYRSCLALAAERKLKSLAFCCISTGVFHFPEDRAAEIAVRTVLDFLQGSAAPDLVIFDVFKDSDAALYRRLPY